MNFKVLQRTRSKILCPRLLRLKLFHCTTSGELLVIDMGSLSIPSPQFYKMHSAGLVHGAVAQTCQHFAGAGLIGAAGRHSNVPTGHTR